MNRERCRELLPIIQAFAEGKQIQFRLGEGEWIDLPDEPYATTFPADDYEYRVAPEPMEIWVTFDSRDGACRAWLTQDEAESQIARTKPYSRYKHFREVIE